MPVISIAECSNILQYCRPVLSYHLFLRLLFCLFLDVANNRYHCILLTVKEPGNVKETLSSFSVTWVPAWVATIIAWAVAVKKQTYQLSQSIRSIEVRKKATLWNWYNLAQHLTKDTTWESDKNTTKHHIQGSQEVRPFPACDLKAAMNRQ